MNPSGSSSAHGAGRAPSLFDSHGLGPDPFHADPPPEGQRILSALAPAPRALARRAPPAPRPANAPTPSGVLVASTLGIFLALCLIAAAAWWWFDGGGARPGSPRSPATPPTSPLAGPAGHGPANPRSSTGAVVESVADASTHDAHPATPKPQPAAAAPAAARTGHPAGPAPARAAPSPTEHKLPAASPAPANDHAAPSRKDSDVALLQALMTHLDKAPRDAGGAAESVLPAATGVDAAGQPTLQHRLDACRDLSGADLTQCRARACSGQWGATPLCPVSPGAREPSLH